MITSAGIGSGLDIESIISQLMQIEREPINNLGRQQQVLDVSISALGSLKNSLSELDSAASSLGDVNKFGSYVASTSDEDVFTAEAASGSRIENHTIEVLSLAIAHQMATDAYPGGADSTVNTGTYSFASGEESFDINLDGTNNTLLGLRDAINDAGDNNTISASVLNLAGGSRLILSSRETGIDNQIQAPALFTEITAAVDATIKIDSFSASSATNAFSDIIPGIILQLKGPGTAKLETGRNVDSFREIYDEFVNSYNALVSSIDSLSEGDLRNDGTLRSIKSDLSQLFFEPVAVKDSEYSPFQLGLTFDRNGILSVDETTFLDITVDDTENFVAAITDPTTGFSQRISDVLEKYTANDGLIAAKEDSFESRKDVLGNQTERMEYRLGQTEERLRRQFTILDTLMTRLQTTSSFLTDQLGSLNNNNT